MPQPSHATSRRRFPPASCGLCHSTATRACRGAMQDMCRWHGDLLTATRTVEGSRPGWADWRLCSHSRFRLSRPRGGTLRVIRSQLGRAGPALVYKATQLADVTPAQFWSGPEHQATPASPRTPPAPTAPPPAASAPPTIPSSLSSWASTPKRTGRSASTRSSSCPGTGSPATRSARPAPRCAGTASSTDQIRGLPMVSRPARRRQEDPRTPPPRRVPTPSMFSCPRNWPRPQPGSPDLSPQPSYSACSSSTAYR